MESQGETGFHWPYRVVADHYGAGLVYDLPHAMSQINGQQLTRWGVDFDEAMDVALDNLRKISEQGFARLAPGVWRSAWRDNYDPSRLLLVDLIAAHEVDGDPVVMVPNRDTLLLTGSEDEVGLGIMAAAAEESTQQPRPIHTMPIRLEFGSWTPFLPPKELPAYLRFKQMLINSLGQDYQEQRALLTTTHQKQSEDVFVASEPESSRVTACGPRAWTASCPGPISSTSSTQDGRTARRSPRPLRGSVLRKSWATCLSP
jgi:hypothetical protein